MVTVFAAACSGEATPFVESTQVLIPSTATFTPSPVPLTNTPPPDLAAPGDIGASTPGVESTDAVSSTTAEELTVDPVASELAMLAQRRIAEKLNLPVRRVRIVEVTPYVWTDTSLGCPVPGETYTALNVDGYRILLSAGDQEYVFHTDFDRALPCNAKYEQLPETTPSP
ncbi:MAG: hypothetical protein ABI690_23120 [Chloroflexota bacterium]